MSRWGKISWFLCGLSIVIVLATRIVAGGWVAFLWAPLIIFVVSLIAAFAVDIKFYLEFLTLRTTKHGMNMGALILLMAVILVSVNFLAVRKNKTWDVTEEGLFTLSDQSRDVLKALQEDINIKVFYRGAKDKEVKQKMMGAFEMYQEMSPKVKVRFVDAYVENSLAKEYLKGPESKDQVAIFVEYKGKSVRVEEPYEEEKITAAMIRATRTKDKTVYFLTGHGERDLESQEDEGMADFKKALLGANYKTAKLNLLEKPEMPADADVVAIVGPKSQIFEAELELLRNYAKKGGHLFIAADPGQKHQIALLTRTFGVEFKNNYVINDSVQLTGRGAAGALGMGFDRNNEITNKFQTGNQYVLFDLASEVAAAADAPKGLNFSPLVQSAPNAFTASELGSNIKPADRRFHTLALAVTGKLGGKEGEPGGADFSAVIFGDSDFVSQKDVGIGLNLDLAMNAVSSLAKETDLISIRPKQPAGTKMTLTSVAWSLLWIASLLMPLSLFSTAGVIWFRRRSA